MFNICQIGVREGEGGRGERERERGRERDRERGGRERGQRERGGEGGGRAHTTHMTLQRDKDSDQADTD